MSRHENSAELLEFLGNPDWRKRCRASSRANTIPSGVTYLSQLLAHDMFMTEPRKNVFLLEKDRGGTSETVNLIDAPLMLGTIYGRTGVADRELYEEQDPNRFDLFAFVRNQKNLRTTQFHRDPRKEWSYPVLADARNYSTPILAQIAYAFMAFHNSLVMKYEKQRADNADIFALARADVIRTWHRIVQNDIIAATCRDVSNVRMPKTMAEAGFWSAPNYLSRGAMRCFHALVREDYMFNKGAVDSETRSPIEIVLSEKIRGPAVGSEQVHGNNRETLTALIARWLLAWEIDLQNFFDVPGERPALNRTGFTPSFTFERLDRADRTMKPIQVLDARRAEELEFGPLLQQGSIDDGIRGLLADVGDAGFGPQSVAPDDIPLTIALLAEGFYDKESADDDLGKLGRVGSTIVWRQLDGAVQQAARRVDEIVNDSLGREQMRGPDQLPRNFVEMVQMTRNGSD